MNDGVFISLASLATFSHPTRTELLAHVSGPAMPSPETEQRVAALKTNSIDLEEDGPPDLSPAQARKLHAGCSPKTQLVLGAIANSSPMGFTEAELLKPLKVTDPGELQGVLSGLTRRTRTVLGDPDVRLIWWNRENDDADWIGRVSEMTHRSLRKAMNL